MFYRAPLDVMPALRTATTHCISAMRRTREANGADTRENSSRLPSHVFLSKPFFFEIADLSRHGSRTRMGSPDTLRALRTLRSPCRISPGTYRRRAGRDAEARWTSTRSRTWGICTRRAGTLERARSRLYRSQILQVNNTKYALESSRRDLHNALLCTDL